MTTYRVTWTEFNVKTSVEDSLEGGTTDMVEIFTDIDQGYDYYQRLRKRWWAMNVTWEHVHD
jgi:hypothetical protein